MAETKSGLPDGLSDNTSSKCFRYKRTKGHPKPKYISYAGKDKAEVKAEAIAYANTWNRKLGPVVQWRKSGVMSKRNNSREVGVSFAWKPAKKGQYRYPTFTADWVGCPLSGGVSIRAYPNRVAEAYVMAVLSRRLKWISRNKLRDRVEEIKGTEQFKQIVGQMPAEYRRIEDEISS